MSEISSEGKLLRMAEQIAVNLGGASDPAAAAERTAAHLRRFWTPQMITELLQFIDSDSAELSPALRLAVRELSGNQ